ncbi:MAG: UDP-N-acetylmuramoyl-L-alanine--D-glutamate ligase, partial [Verrucomicrobia bacterium]
LWLNLSPNHLDRYHNFEDYRKAKLRIFLNQTAEDFAVVNARDQLPRLAAKQVTFSAEKHAKADFTQRNGKIYFRGAQVLDQESTHLQGIHNAENLMAALAAGHCLGLEFAAMTQTVSQYTPPEHRCELVQERRGVRWINDSKSTNLDALEKAIRSQTGPLILIAGGKDKGFEFDDIGDLVAKRVKIAILIGEMRNRIAASWQNVTSRVCETLDEAVCLADSLSQRGDTVVFSPGTSSYDMFLNYEDRGNRFKKLVRSLPD